MNNFLRILVAMCLSAATSSAQKLTPTDTLSDKTIDRVTVQAWKSATAPTEQLPEVHNTYITAGKRSEVIRMDQTQANVVEKTVRQVMAKIPGAFAYDMDGSGNQINFSLRGLDPHRSWDMNVRQNGILLNSDLYGYPASHYNPPLESIDRIELIRGTAALQYGAMFGGLINYVTKLPDTTKPITFENQSAAGSFGLLSTYNSLGGHHGNVTWQTYYYTRASEGYRDNGDSKTQAQFANVAWQINERLRIKAEFARSQYVYHIPGPLNDSMFAADPRQSTRSRNYYSPDIMVPSVTLDWKLGQHTQLQWVAQHLTGKRNSVQFIGAADRRDTINLLTGQYTNRQVDIDAFSSSTTEARLLHHYNIGYLQSVVAGGVRLIYNDLHRRQLGKGTNETDYDLTLVDPNWGRDLHYRTRNAAVFVENLLYLSSKLSISPGIRLEKGITEMTGTIRNLPPERIPENVEHQFVLLGCSFEYKPGRYTRVYGGFSQAYRPVIMGEFIPANDLERVDPNLTDSRGYNAELGVQSDFWNKRIRVNATLFTVQYNDRIGNQAFEDTDGVTRFLKTNVGDSRTNGLELYAEATLVQGREANVSVYTSTAYMDALYINGQLASGAENVDLKGNYVESVPRLTSRNGVQANWRRFSASLQYSFVDETYSDPYNTEQPNANGTRGIVPAYALLDAHVGVTIMPNVRFRLSMNNLMDRSYFTKRPTIYPGPAVWPSDGRSVVGMVTVRL
jgi:Fe(3+) dicitrate transport protein